MIYTFLVWQLWSYRTFFLRKLILLKIYQKFLQPDYINFTKANDETNIKYYKLQLTTDYEINGDENSSEYDLGYVLPSGQNTYSFNLPYEKTKDDSLENAKSIHLSVTPVNPHGEIAPKVSSLVQDVGSDVTTELKTPVLDVTTSEALSLTASNYDENG